MKKPNSHECAYFGRKLSNIETGLSDDDDCSICIGTANDDQIYFPIPEQNFYPEGDLLKERVWLYVENTISDDFGTMNEIDLEGILRFAAKYCRGIYDRVSEEVTPVGFVDREEP